MSADPVLAALLTRRVRQLLGRQLAGVVADSGFTSRAAVAALLRTGVPFILGFSRTAPIRARLAALSGQQRRWVRDGGAIRLGTCPWDARLRLIAVGARSPTDRRGPWVYLTSLRSYGPQRLIALYRQRGRVEQTIDELLNGHDFDHLVSYRLHPNRIAVGFRLLARNLAIGLQLATAEQSPSPSVNAARSAPLTSMASAPSWSKVARSLFARFARRPLSSSTSAGPTAWSTSRLEFKLPDLR
jgi:hypothetical protein